MSRSADNVHGYSAPIWRHFTETAHGGRPENTAGWVVAEAGSRADRSRLRLYARVDGETVREARFEAHGCPTAIAVGDWLCAQLSERAAAALPALDARQIRSALEIPDARAHCALLGEDAIRALIEQLQTPPP